MAKTHIVKIGRQYIIRNQIAAISRQESVTVIHCGGSTILVNEKPEQLIDEIYGDDKVIQEIEKASHK